MYSFNTLNGQFRLLRWITGFVATGWFSEAVLLYAQVQAEDNTAAANQKSYFFAYAFVVFVIALGLAIVARSGNRAEKQKMIEQDLAYRLNKMSGKSSDH